VEAVRCGKRELGVASNGHPEVRGHSPAEQALVDPAANLVYHTGDLSARGHR
jgi:hypothetical protein